MTNKKNIEFNQIEPLKENRFLIKTVGAEIHPFLFRNYKIFNEGDELIFETTFYETVDYTFNPVDFFKITGIVLEYLDPVGEIVGGLNFDVKGSNFMRKQSYKNDNLQINKLRFIVDKNSMISIFKPKNDE